MAASTPARPITQNDIDITDRNWRSGKFILSKINCRSEKDKGVYCLQYDDDRIVSGLRDNTIKIWDRATLECSQILTGHTGSVLCVQYDENIIVSGSSDSTVRVWNMSHGELVNTLVHHSEGVLHVRFQNGMMVTCSRDRSIAVWDMLSPTEIALRSVLTGHKAAVNVVEFDEKYIVSASGDRKIKVWNTSTCELVRTLEGHKRGIACLQYKDRLIASGSSDNTIRLWDIESGECLRVLEGHEAIVRCIRFDSKRIVSGDYDGKIKIWDLQAALDPQSFPSSLCIKTMKEHTGRVFRLQFDDFQIVSGSHDDTILIWEFSNVGPTYVGLNGKDATSCMNSLLQALYFTNTLRKAVYLIPTETDNPVRSVPLAIQQIFYELQTHDKPVGTKQLAKSFGWETMNSSMHHDAQELCRLLLNKIDSTTEGTRVEGTIPSLFEGKMLSFVRCTHIDYESSREESFMDIQLTVKEKKDVYESLDDYTATELLDGSNRYDAGDHGLQEAEKGVTFVSFPPILHLQLKRFQYDPGSERNVKINDRFEFPERLDLTKYVKDSQGQSFAYFLHAVLVHRGDAEEGDYFVYIDPMGDGKWCKFDNDIVTRCHKTEAIGESYGAASGGSIESLPCASMLMYIRESMRDEMLHAIDENDVPGYLRVQLEEQRATEKRRQQEENERSLYSNLRVVTEDDFVAHQGHDLVDFERTKRKKPYRLRKNTILDEFPNILAEWFGHHQDHVRYWPWHTRQDESLRPMQLSLKPEQLKNKTVQELTTKLPHGGNELIIFLDILPFRKTTSGLNDGQRRNDEMVLFFRQYDPVGRVLEYKGFDFYPSKMSPEEVLEACNQKAGFPKGTSLLVAIANDLQENMLLKVVGPKNASMEGLGRAISRGSVEVKDMDLLIFQKVEDNRMNPPIIPTFTLLTGFAGEDQILVLELLCC